MREARRTLGGRDVGAHGHERLCREGRRAPRAAPAGTPDARAGAMKTGTLVEALARGPIGVDARAVERRLGIALLVGISAATAAMLIALGPRPDLHAAVAHVAFWIKLAYPASLAALALAATSSLARPVRAPGMTTLALSALVVGTLAAALLA